MSFLRTNIAEKLLAVALTVLLFWSVNRSQTSEATTSFVKHVTLEGVPRGMKVVGEPPRIQLTAIGDREAVERITSAEQAATTVSVRLSGARVGTQMCDVFPSIRPSLLDGLKWKVDPERVEVTLASESDVTLTVRAVPTTEPTGFKARSWTADPATVLVSGEERLVSRVVRAEIRYDPEDPAAFDTRYPIVLVDQRGRAITRGQFALSPATGHVVPSKTASVIKHLPILPVWSGVVPKGYRLAGYRVMPGQIEVRGVGAVLERLSSVTTQPVVLSGLTSDQTITAKLIVPEGVQLPRPVTAQIQLSIEKSEEPD